MSHGIHGDVRRREIVRHVRRGLAVLADTVGGDAAGEARKELGKVRKLAVDNQAAALRQALREEAERVADVIEILEEIQVILVDI